MAWDPPEIPDDPDEATERIIDGLVENLPGWEPVEGDPLVILAAELARENTAVNANLVTIIELAFAAIGQTVHGFPPHLGSTATIDVELTVTTAGITLPEGLIVVGTNSDGAEVAFELVEPVVASSTTVAVTMRCTEIGYVGNTVPVGALILQSATPTVIAADATTESAGGVDPETPREYLDRYVDYVATLRPGGVRAADLTALARSVPGVHRAFALDLYDPADPANPAERTVTVFLVDEAGLPVEPGVASAVADILEASREVNFVFHVEDPSFTSVAIVYSVLAEVGADPVVVESAIDAAVLDWLTSWASTPDDESAWLPWDTVRYNQVIQVIGSVDGVTYVESVTINGVAADLALSGVAPLPTSPNADTTPSTVTGTVNTA